MAVHTYPCLEIIAGPQEGLTLPLTQGEHLLGRSKTDGALYLEDTSVSRVHARILVTGESVTIEDTVSRNGTFVNGIRLLQKEQKLLSHLDHVQTGIYAFRFLTHKPAPEELEAGHNQPHAPEEEKSEDEAFNPNEEVKIESALVNVEEEKSLVIHPFANEEKGEVIGKKLIRVFVLICILSALGSVGYYLNTQLQSGPDQALLPAPEARPTSAPVPEPPPAPAPKTIPSPSPSSPSLRGYPSFLDIRSEPASARIYFKEKLLGLSPLKVPVTLNAGEDYAVTAEFDLRDLNDVYRQTLTFRADPRTGVIPLTFRAELGVLKITKLPRTVNFYLEASYSSGKSGVNSVRLDSIVYGRPVYLPFGKYAVLLREKTRMGDSNTFVDEIRYHREFEINAEKRAMELAVTERSLQFFPARIQSTPLSADLYLDGKKVGTTPFDGELPLGAHELKLVKEGYFETMAKLDMRTNTPYEAKFELKTSEVGRFINKARDLRRSGQHSQAVDQLVEALKLGGTEREKAEIHLILGECYDALGNLNDALAYFGQAKTHPDFYYRALLGGARVQQALGDADSSLMQVAEILINLPDSDPAKKEARSLFKQLSPLKSVIYVSTDPAGATVFVNNRELEQKTPLLVSDLGLGNYRLEIQKPGYQVEQVRQNLKLSDFVPVVVKLKPAGL